MNLKPTILVCLCLAVLLLAGCATPFTFHANVGDGEGLVIGLDLPRPVSPTP